MSKHHEIVNYILSLEAGYKISVRSIASELGVSEGTAYKAIKECEALGIVSTIPRVGTVRVEKVDKRHEEILTFADVVNIVEGSILGGKEGIHKILKKFVIGAMTIDAMHRYITPECLLIVGNREEAHELALKNEAAVLISGGFACSDEIKKLADEKKLPIISSRYDTFTIATMINRAMSENLIKKDIILVEDIMKNKPAYLMVTDNIGAWREMVKKTKHIRYPVVDKDLKVVGVITSKDLSVDVGVEEPISKIMTKDPITVTPKTTVAYAAHIMGGEDIELCPVVDGRKLVGVITRQDVIKALHYMSKHPQAVDTLEDLILKNFTYEREGDRVTFSGSIIPQMLHYIGTASWSSLNMLLSTAGLMALRVRSMNVSLDNMSTYFMKPVQGDSNITIIADIIDIGRNYCKVEVNMHNKKKELIGKAILSAKLIRD